MSVEHLRPRADRSSYRPFTRQEGLAAGLTDRQLRSPRFHRLHTGVYIDARAQLTPRLRAEAAVLAFAPTAFASHATAARIWAVPIPALPEEHVTVVRREDRRVRAGVVCHCLVGRSDETVRIVDGIRVTSPERTFVELAAQLSLVDLVVVGDDLVRRRLVTLKQLRGHCTAATGEGAAQSRIAVAFVRERVDSPMESRLRMLIVLAGLASSSGSRISSVGRGSTTTSGASSW